jgi:hypothetical protein
MFLTAVGWWLPRFEKLDMGHDIAGSRWLEEAVIHLDRIRRRGDARPRRRRRHLAEAIAGVERDQDAPDG